MDLKGIDLIVRLDFFSPLTKKNIVPFGGLIEVEIR